MPYDPRSFAMLAQRQPPPQAPQSPLGTLTQQRGQQGQAFRDTSDEALMASRPATPPSPSPWPNHASTQRFPGGQNNALRPLSPPSPGEVYIPEPQPMMPSGFDPTAMSPFKAQMSPGRPAGDMSSVLSGLRQNQSSQHPLLQLAGMSQNPAMGEAQGYAQSAGAGRDQFVQQQLAPQEKRQGMIDTALAQQHPAIQGLQELESQRRALPQQLEAQGRILAEREQARGIIGGAQANAAGRQRAAVLAGLAPLLQQLGLAQERQQQSAVDGLDQFSGANEQAIRALQQIVAEYYQRPEFDYED